MSDSLKTLQECVRDVSNITERIEELESQLKAMKAHRKRMTDKVMLDLMLDCGLSTISSDSLKLEIKEYISGTWPKDIHQAQLATIWLEENNADGIIKYILTADFPKGDFEKAHDAQETLRDLGIRPSLKKGVHTMTLRAWARKRLENGEPINLDVLGLYAGQTVKITKLNK